MSPSSPRRPRRVVARTLALGLGLVFAAGALAASPGATSGWNQSYAEGTLWQLLNGARTNNGMAPLQQHGTLVSLARWRSRDMLDRNYFSHTIPGCNCLVYAYYDSNGLKYAWAGENIAWNSGRTDEYSPVRAHEQFMGSPGHRANVLNPAFTHGGVGAAAADNQMFLGHVQNTRMYTQLFMQAASAPAPAPAPTPAPRPPSQPAPAPAPPPPSGGGGSGAPAQPAAAAPTPTPEPVAKVVQVAAPVRPVSSAGLDGVATPVVAPSIAVDLVTHHQLDELAAKRAGTPTAQPVPAVAAAPPLPATLAVQAPAAPESGLLDSIVGAVLGFLFG
jgi:uncharacterized protein YkwD